MTSHPRSRWFVLFYVRVFLLLVSQLSGERVWAMMPPIIIAVQCIWAGPKDDQTSKTSPIAVPSEFGQHASYSLNEKIYCI